MERWEREPGSWSKGSQRLFRIVTSFSEALGTVHTGELPSLPRSMPEAEAELPESHMSPQASAFTTLPSLIQHLLFIPKREDPNSICLLRGLKLAGPWREPLVKKESKDFVVLRPG